MKRNQPKHPQASPSEGSALIGWRRCCGTAVRRGSGAPTFSRSGHYASELTRRRFLGSTAKGFGLAALLGGLPRGWIGSVYASDAPESPRMRFGIIALTDCSPIVIAHEKGCFKKYGIESTVAKGANWAAIRDSLSSGDNQGTHMLIGMPIASTMGLLGSPRKPMIIPWLLNRNGQAISLANKFKGKVEGLTVPIQQPRYDHRLPG